MKPGDSTFVARAMSDVPGLRLDARRLMPLREARRVLRARREYRKEDAPLVWAALLSLKDAGEFVRVAKRMRFFFHAPGVKNTAPLDRYGPAVLPWLASAVKGTTLRNVPDAILPCLMQLGNEEALDVVWRIRKIYDGRSLVGPGPFAVGSPGDVDVVRGDPAREVGSSLIVDWIARHPRVGRRALVRRAGSGERRARDILRELASRWPGELRRVAREELGAERAARLVPAGLTTRFILRHLDRYAAGKVETESDPWPAFLTEFPEDEYHAMRILAARAKKGDGWGIAFERVSGHRPEVARVVRYIYGSEVTDQGETSYRDLGLYVEKKGRRVELVGPDGPLVFARSKSLRPGASTCKPAPRDPSFNLFVRAYLSTHPRAFFSATLLDDLDLDDPEVIFDSDAFEHVVGPDELPSSSPFYVSLAAAIATRDPSRVSPGRPNTDWRQHAIFR